MALQVELCSPRLIRLARNCALVAFGLSAGVLAAGPVQPVYSSHPLPALRSAFRQASWPDAERRGVELSPWPASWSKIRKWLGLGKKS
jgi:hypothetical protein